jgi:hypothetical protein
MAHNPFELMDCPDPITWTNDIRRLFTEVDIDHMKQAKHIDLGDYMSVKIWATKIYKEVSSGDMPPPGSGEAQWTSAMVNTFGCWIKQGCPEE